jgi:hypothetical protein
MISRAQIRAALAAASLEWLLTHPLAFGLETATDLQRSVCRVAEGQPVTMTESVRRGFGCDTLPTCAPREIILLGGVRTAKSLLAAAAAIRCSQRVDVSGLRRGEVPRVSIVSLDKDKADVVLTDHLRGTVASSPMLRHLVLDDKPSQNAVLLRHPSGRPVEVKVVAGKRAGGSLVARWAAGVIFDEAPRMVGSDEGVVNLDDARTAVQARLLPGSMLLEIGSPWAPFGPVYELFTKHHGSPSDDLVVVKGRGPDLNPVWWTPERCERLAKLDSDAYETDVNANFMSPESSLYSNEVLLRCVRSGSPTLAHDPYAAYWAAMDPATRSNAWTLVIATRRGNKRVVAFAKQWIGSSANPLSPRAVLEEIAAICREYGIRTVETDQYHIDSLVDLAKLETVKLALLPRTLTEMQKVEKYISVRTQCIEGQVELPADPALLADMRRVKRVVRQGGVSIVLPVTSDGRHCDYAPSLMLALTRNLADVKDPPKVQEDPETKRMREAHFARRRAMREGMVTA